MKLVVVVEHWLGRTSMDNPARGEGDKRTQAAQGDV